MERRSHRPFNAIPAILIMGVFRLNIFDSYFYLISQGSRSMVGLVGYSHYFILLSNL